MSFELFDEIKGRNITDLIRMIRFLLRGPCDNNLSILCTLSRSWYHQGKRIDALPVVHLTSPSYISTLTQNSTASILVRMERPFGYHFATVYRLNRLMKMKRCHLLL